MKPSNDGLGSSTVGLLYPNVKDYLDELVGRILDNNQVQEERIMAQIEGVQRKMKTSR